ncbi:MULTISPECIES: SseB family protein [unclassified Schaalia]|uniref:SseB family protein n=1 Tax=unclassified Schaalia TaxID=2691889 RepID=UPI001E30A7D6|nr:MULTISPECIES: SseB family protein [unclassified Schaalia]MCD4549881.1 SseB family protein [Schaalia sp. lx-260]MCD4556897.1 SseB family protein [Schaalia sp. lx-100]
MSDKSRSSFTHDGQENSVALTEEQRKKLRSRIHIRGVDRSDRGDTFPLTAAALSIPTDSDWGAQRLEALVEALSLERVIVPVQVEVLSGEKKLQELVRADSADTDCVTEGESIHEQAIFPLKNDETSFQEENFDGMLKDSHPDVHAGEENEYKRVGWVRRQTPDGPALAVYTSVEQLYADCPQARPMPLAARKVALTALVETSGRIIIDPVGAAVVLPRPATAALAQGDQWLPAWKDSELLRQLHVLAGVEKAHVTEKLPENLPEAEPFPCSWLQRVQVECGPQGCVYVRIVCDQQIMNDPQGRARVGRVIARCSQSPRLRAASDRVQFIPVFS